ncbi:MAG: winged helix-turn-helix transcriptional regulator [Clostridia bacterium]|nr:winged helix-turn-helix transcriptional regulator [Clostridia bacterium]
MSKNEFICDCHPINKELVEQTKKAMPDSKTVKNLANFFNIVGDSTRCKILFALKETPLCVCDLANVLSMTKSSISHQLNKMKSAGVVKCKRNGKQIFYSLDDEHVIEIFDISITHTIHKAKENGCEK